MTVEKYRMNTLKTYTRAVVHLRRQFLERRFGLVLGAGVSGGFGIPVWKDFVMDIAKDAEVLGEELIGPNSKSRDGSLPYKTELLFQRYWRLQVDRLKRPPSLEDENSIGANWLTICQKYLYPATKREVNDALKEHLYFKSLVELIQNSHITINFNFDHYIEKALFLSKRIKDKSNLGFETVTNPWPQSKRKDSVIYHPHGMIPSGTLMEAPVDRFVFTEAGYAKQYVGAGNNDTSFLLAHFAKNTCVIVGCSLEDALRTILLQGAHINPGNYHYYVHYHSEGRPRLSEAEKQAISDTNFKVYNLITLFLDDKGIQAFFDLINSDTVSQFELRGLAKRSAIPLHFNFYMTGALGVGKSTTANNLRSLVVLDEWLLPRPKILGTPPEALTSQMRQEADNWIATQFHQKNETLRELADGDGVIAIVDRPPLDPLAFTPDEKDRPSKATSLLNTICPDRQWKVQSGVVILLKGNPVELSARVKATGRPDYTSERLAAMQRTLSSIYCFEGVKVIDTVGMSVAEVTRRVAEIIYRNEYIPCDLNAQLKSYESQKL